MLTDQDHWCFQLRFGGPSAPQPFYRPEVCALRPVLLDDTGRRGTTESQQDIVMYVVCVYIYIYTIRMGSADILYIYEIYMHPQWYFQHGAAQDPEGTSRDGDVCLGIRELLPAENATSSSRCNRHSQVLSAWCLGSLVKSGDSHECS